MPLGRCPLPPDPGYEATSNYYSPETTEREVSPLGRIRPEAREIASRHTKGIIAMILSNEDARQPSFTRKRDKGEVNHSRANKRRIHEIQVRCQSRQREQGGACAERPLPPRHKDKYSHVTSKLGQYLPRPCTAAVQRVEEEKRERENSDPALGNASNHDRRSQMLSRRPETTPSCERHCSQSDTRPAKLKRNFIFENITGASGHKIKQQPKVLLLNEELEKKKKRDVSYKRGAVPQYLIERKEEWRREEEERLASIPDPTVPPGHIVMPTSERLETLGTLKQHQEELLRDLQSLSLTADTLRISVKRNQLGSRLNEVEDAIKIFSKPRVFVKVDE